MIFFVLLQNHFITFASMPYSTNLRQDRTVRGGGTRLQSTAGIENPQQTTTAGKR